MNKTVTALEGASILEAAIDNDIDLQHECGGNCVCATCHVHITKGIESLSSMDELEDNRLDDAVGRLGKSRLACQARITKANTHVVVEIPSLRS